MLRKIGLAVLLIFASAVLLTGCNQKSDANSNRVGNPSQTGQVSDSGGTNQSSAGDITDVQNSFVRSDNGEGGVQVQAIWITPDYLKDSGGDLASKYDFNKNYVFEISMTTHMGDLTKYPIIDKAELKVDDKVIKPARWDIISNTTHHPKGFLVFSVNNKILKQGSNLQLTLRELQGIPERNYDWRQ